MTRVRSSPCKINLLLNVLGRRPDGFHELETLLHPVGLCDELVFERTRVGLELTSDHPGLPVDGTNLVHRATQAFLRVAGVAAGIRIHLRKRVPLAAGLGGGSSNAAHTLLGLNELFEGPLDLTQLRAIAESLGSDVPFFLQSGPALGTGRGEQITPLEPFPCLRSVYGLLIHPGFGVSTPWAYQQLSRFPAALNGLPGRARALAEVLDSSELPKPFPALYNSLEAPVYEKYPILGLYREFLEAEGALATQMSGSGSTTFALLESRSRAETLAEKFKSRFGPTPWTAVVALGSVQK
jgi:4-diphosphocytidyl-2-C-methyl-D-erythritol kinase